MKPFNRRWLSYAKGFVFAVVATPVALSIYVWLEWRSEREAIRFLVGPDEAWESSVFVGLAVPERYEAIVRRVPDRYVHYFRRCEAVNLQFGELAPDVAQWMDMRGESWLRGLDYIESLSLPSEVSTDRLLACVTNLPSLSKLYVEGPGVSDVTLMRLANLEGLHTLSIPGSSVTDTGVEKSFEIS